MRFLGRFLAGVCLAAGAASTVAAAPFVPTACVQLETQLINLDRGGGDPTTQNYRQYDEALTRQRTELERANADAARMGCAPSFGFFRPARDQRCDAVLGTIERMQANYDRLRARRDTFSFNPYTVDRDRSQILRALADNNCGPQYASYRSNFFSFFGGFNDRRDDSYYGGTSGTYRTLCVRTCDGYYFPISFATVQGKFASDQETCAAMCPNTETVLFVHRNPGEESEAMVSLTGQPYSKLPTAFAYRNSYNPACTCNSAAANATPLPGRVAVMLRAPAPRVLPVPIRRPQIGEDPETLANRAGGFELATLPRQIDSVARATGPDGRDVRVVGPTYYYAQ